MNIILQTITIVFFPWQIVCKENNKQIVSGRLYWVSNFNVNLIAVYSRQRGNQAKIYRNFKYIYF